MIHLTTSNFTYPSASAEDHCTTLGVITWACKEGKCKLSTKNQIASVFFCCKSEYNLVWFTVHRAILKKIRTTPPKKRNASNFGFTIKVSWITQPFLFSLIRLLPEMAGGMRPFLFSPRWHGVQEASSLLPETAVVTPAVAREMKWLCNPGVGAK